MDLNPIDDMADAAQDLGNSILKKKRKLVKYVANKVTPSGPSIGSGLSDRKPKYYTKKSGRILGRKR